MAGKNDDNKTKNYSFFSNTACEYYPCHETEDKNNFNCLFCYCPLYSLGEKCGGNFTLMPDGRKDCSSCMLPHKRENYELIIKNIC
ncbi:MAG: cysteine-rich small domain-containing protein [Oscillospiraceae bacterium]|nr:cysteine-rich small domain-containing protein [Oscillospiraceae bacterium]